MGRGWSRERSGFPIGLDSCSLKFWALLAPQGTHCCLALGTQASWRVRAGLQQAPCQAPQPAHQESCC